MQQQEREIFEMVEALGRALLARGWRLAGAESCSGGLAGHLLTSVGGSSDWFVGGVVAYANEVKEQMLGVPGEVLAAHGAVSRETVRAMAAGALRLPGADAAFAISGVAGPTGGTPQKPVGMVWIAWAWPDAEAPGGRGGLREEQEVFHFSGDRAAVKLRSAVAAINGMLARVSASGGMLARVADSARGPERDRA